MNTSSSATLLIGRTERMVAGARWLQREAGSTATSTYAASDALFVAGSWGRTLFTSEQSGNSGAGGGGTLSVWKVALSDISRLSRHALKAATSGRARLNSKLPLECLAEIELDNGADVTDVQALGSTRVIAATNAGRVEAFSLGPNEAGDGVEIVRNSSILAHRHYISSSSSSAKPAMVTALAVQPVVAHQSRGNMPETTESSYDPEIASVGSDGRLVFTKPFSSSDVVDHYVADQSTLNDVAWITSTQLAVATSGGLIKLFDRRQPNQPIESRKRIDFGSQVIKPFQVFTHPVKDRFAQLGTSVTCLDVHKFQANLIATGDNHGTVLLWDMRNASEPVLSSEQHEQTAYRVMMDKSMDAEMGVAVKSVMFHPNHASQLFVSFADGTCSVIDWTKKNSIDEKLPMQVTLRNSRSVLPVNSLDYHRQSQTLLCGSDGESVLAWQGNL
ncbi:WD40 repeat-like protein [Ramicandelaber brevisporus]|nr:WD40 repeat-like protein [Ramicandelaber brevisporus]